MYFNQVLRINMQNIFLKKSLRIPKGQSETSKKRQHNGQTKKYKE